MREMCTRCGEMHEAIEYSFMKGTIKILNCEFWEKPVVISDEYVWPENDGRTLEEVIAGIETLEI